MPSTLKAAKASSAKNSIPKPSKGKGKAKAVSEPAPTNPKSLPHPADSSESRGEEDLDAAEDDESAEGSDEDEDNDGVDEEGMARLMQALGEDGLDDFDTAQLQALEEDEDEEWETDDDDEEEEEEDADADLVEGSDSGSEEDIGDAELEGEQDSEGPNASDEEEEEEEEDIALDDIEGSVDEDAVPRQKIEIDNKIALERIRETIQLDPSLPWTETLTVTYHEAIEVDVNDDLNRELAFYKQALHGANKARALALKANFPFTRPADYFAEMVKSDSHMERIRQRLLDESAGIKKGEEKRREREGKKFGKQVQIEKIKEREKGKKDMEERLQGLKRKRKGALDNAQADDADGFDVAVEDAISDRPAKRGRGTGGSKLSRTSRDSKFGFGGAGKRSKQNDRASTDNFDSGPGRGRGGFRGGARGGRGGARGGGRGGRDDSEGGGRGGRSARGGRGSRGGGRGGSKRPGKDKRVAARSRS
ncbi:hypothetical protein HWV62_253 [Athelia sp. TMB]|nr:hypothetical protein HWV62_253 [Athelia sp. TMB]